MEDLQTLNKIVVKSNVIGSYTAEFVSEIKPFLKELYEDDKNVFIIDKKVNKLYPELFNILLKYKRYVFIEVSESNKTIDYSQKVLEELLKIGLRKNSTLIAVGGGITQDIVAFISSIVFRGVDWKFIPTTLLAQCDSCIGSKSSINFLSYKNLVGTFKPPSHIYIFTGFLQSLTEDEIRSGIGEMLHYFLTEGIKLASNLVNDIQNILKDKKVLENYINESLRIKKKIIEIDEYDETIRHIFNYGHTFGHALESITKYKISHGQAVTLGIDLANFISFKLGYISESLFLKIHKILNKNKPEFYFNNNNIKSYLNALSKDKKNKGDLIGCILLKKIGLVEKEFIKNDIKLKKIILEYSKKY